MERNARADDLHVLFVVLRESLTWAEWTPVCLFEMGLLLQPAGRIILIYALEEELFVRSKENTASESTRITDLIDDLAARFRLPASSAGNHRGTERAPGAELLEKPPLGRILAAVASVPVAVGPDLVA